MGISQIRVFIIFWIPQHVRISSKLFMLMAHLFASLAKAKFSQRTPWWLIEEQKYKCSHLHPNTAMEVTRHIYTPSISPAGKEPPVVIQ